MFTRWAPFDEVEGESSLGAAPTLDPTTAVAIAPATSTSRRLTPLELVEEISFIAALRLLLF